MSINASDYNTTHSQLLAVKPERAYSDLDLRFQKHPIYDDVRPVKDIEAVKNAVKNLILTNRGERPFQPEVGSSIYELLFEHNNPYILDGIQTRIRDMLSAFEPRINQVSVIIRDLDNNAIHVKVGFNIRDVAPSQEVEFYLERLR